MDEKIERVRSALKNSPTIEEKIRAMDIVDYVRSIHWWCNSCSDINPIVMETGKKVIIEEIERLRSHKELLREALRKAWITLDNAGFDDESDSLLEIFAKTKDVKND